MELKLQSARLSGLLANSSRTRNYLTGLLSGYVLAVGTSAVALWLTPFTLRFLDREQYAIYCLGSDVLIWLGLLDVGVTAGLTVQAAQLTGRPDLEQMNRLASTAFWAQMAVVAAVLLVGMGIAVAFPHLFAVRPSLQRHARVMCTLMVLNSAICLGTRTFSTLLVAHQQIAVNNGIQIGLFVLRVALTVVLLLYGSGIIALAIADLVSSIVTGVVTVRQTFSSIPGLSIRGKSFSWMTLREIWSPGMWLSLSSVGFIMKMNLDKIVAARILSVADVTTFVLTGRLYTQANSLLAQVTNTARPALGQLMGQGALDRAVQVYRRIFSASFGSAIIVLMSLWACNAAFVTRWVGPRNYGGCALDVALALNVLVYAMLLPNRALMTAAMQVKHQTLVGLVEGVLNLSLSVFLARRIGLVGVAASTALAAALTSLWIIPYLAARTAGRSVAGFWIEDVGPNLFLAGALLPVALLSHALAGVVGGFPGAAIALVLTGLFGLLLGWLILLDSQQRHRVLAFVKR
jgi:O-antigen/teichoic acid export membrane protein